MALGDSHFDIGMRLLGGFDTQAVEVQVIPSQADQAVPRDKFMRPIQTSEPITASIVVNKAEEDIKPNESGGQPVEVLEFYAKVGTINENDEVVWNGHTFRTSSVWPFGLAGVTNLLFCKAEREVDK